MCEFFFFLILSSAPFIASAATSMNSCIIVKQLNSQLCRCSGINIAIPLSVSTKERQCAVIQFLRAKGVPGAEINHRLSAQYGNSALLQHRV
jgi:hypothetical protein